MRKWALSAVVMFMISCGSDNWGDPTVGVLDPEFGAGGKTITSVGSFGDFATAMALQTDGRIIVVGCSSNGTNCKLAAARYERDGSLDVSFGENGSVITSIGNGEDGAYGVAIQANRKIVVAGASFNGADNDFAIVRYNSDGSLDTTFASDGIVTTAIGAGLDVANDVAIQSDGKIVAAGCSDDGTACKLAVVRYNQEGSLDSTFGIDGKVTTSIGPGEDGAYAVAIQSDRKILVAGGSFNGANQDFAVVRYNSDGSLDSTFDQDGIVTTSVGSGLDLANAMALQPDGRIVVAGCSENTNICKLAVARYNSDGSLDLSFDGNGSVITSIGNGEDGAYGVAIQSDGKIVAAGASFNGSDRDFALVRYNIDGSLDTTFGVGGKLTSLIGAGDDIANGMAIQADGQIVLAGSSGGGDGQDFALAGYR